jgi:protein CLEC16A
MAILIILGFLLNFTVDPLTLMFVVKDFVIEALRSIAELMIYGDQHDPSFFE